MCALLTRRMACRESPAISFTVRDASQCTAALTVHAFPVDPPVEWSSGTTPFKHTSYQPALTLSQYSASRLCLGTESQRILARPPPNEPEEQRHQFVVDALDAHFGTRFTVITEAKAFINEPRRQENTSSSTSSQLATKCQFGYLHDQMIHDYLIKGMESPAVRELFLREKDDLFCTLAIYLIQQQGL